MQDKRPPMTDSADSFDYDDPNQKFFSLHEVKPLNLMAPLMATEEAL